MSERPFRLRPLPGFDGLLLTFNFEGKEVGIPCTVEMLRDIIRQTYAAFGATLPNTQEAHPTLELSSLEVVHAGQSQLSGSLKSQLLLCTVQIAALTLEADESALKSMRDQIDKVLALRGGHETVQ
jgi:hypothetical protein